jgi:hypothetical protein
MAEPAQKQTPRRKRSPAQDSPSVIDYGGTPDQTESPSTSTPPPSTSTVEPEPAREREPERGTVFVSYAHQDAEFFKHLMSRLVAVGWKVQVLGEIRSCDAYLFVVSPDSINAEHPQAELSAAIHENKPVFPVVCRALNADEAYEMPLALRELKWIYMRNPEEFERGFAQLVEVLAAIPITSTQISTTLDFAHNDRPTGKDQLDYQTYARAFAQILASPHTKPPLTIGLYAAWGMGKSFLMNKIKEELRAKERRSRENDQTELCFHFIDFNAWEYSTSDNLWAGLITSLYGQVEKAYKPWQIYRFRWTKRFRKNLRKTFGWGGVFTLLGLALALFLDEGTAGQVTDVFSNLQNLFGTAFLSGSTLAALIAFLRAARDLLDSTAPRSKELQSMVSRKDFSTQIGFMDEIKGEIADMLTLIRDIEKGKRAVRFVIFVDDLDRCPPSKAVEVLEAILLLLSYQEGDAPFFVFLAIDARVIVKAVEVHYGKMLTEAGISGYEFLDKVVQIPFRIPPAGPDAMKRYIQSLLWQSDEARTEAEQRRAQSAPSTTPLPDAPQPLDSPTSTPALLPEPIPEEPFTEEEQTAFETYAPFITPNPRRMKRIVNIYRITRYLLNTGGNTGQGTPPAREAVIKWVVISEEWPFRTAWMLQQIEDDYQLGIGLSKTPEATLLDIYQKVKHHVKDERAKPLLALDSDPESFDQFITLAPVLTVQEIYHTLRPLTFNLNPAMRSEVLRAAAVNSVGQP